MFDHKIGKERSYSSIYNDKKNVKTGKEGNQFKPIQQRKIASLNANAMIIGTPINTKE